VAHCETAGAGGSRPHPRRRARGRAGARAGGREGGRARGGRAPASAARRPSAPSGCRPAPRHARSRACRPAAWPRRARPPSWRSRRGCVRPPPAPACTPSQTCRPRRWCPRQPPANRAGLGQGTPTRALSGFRRRGPSAAPAPQPLIIGPAAACRPTCASDQTASTVRMRAPTVRLRPTTGRYSLPTGTRRGAQQPPARAHPRTRAATGIPAASAPSGRAFCAGRRRLAFWPGSHSSAPCSPRVTSQRAERAASAVTVPAAHTSVSTSDRNTDVRGPSAACRAAGGAQGEEDAWRLRRAAAGGCWRGGRRAWARGQSQEYCSPIASLTCARVRRSVCCPIAQSWSGDGGTALCSEMQAQLTAHR